MNRDHQLIYNRGLLGTRRTLGIVGILWGYRRDIVAITQMWGSSIKQPTIWSLGMVGKLPFLEWNCGYAAAKTQNWRFGACSSNLWFGFVKPNCVKTETLGISAIFFIKMHKGFHCLKKCAKKIIQRTCLPWVCWRKGPLSAGIIWTRPFGVAAL